MSVLFRPLVHVVSGHRRSGSHGTPTYIMQGGVKPQTPMMHLQGQRLTTNPIFCMFFFMLYTHHHRPLKRKGISSSGKIYFSLLLMFAQGSDSFRYTGRHILITSPYVCSSIHLSADNKFCVNLLLQVKIMFLCSLESLFCNMVISIANNGQNS